MQEIMTPEQVADYLQVDTEAVYRLIRQEKLAASRIGREYRIPRQDVEAFLLARSTRERVEQKLVTEVMEFAVRQNPHLSSDDVLEELERMDDERRASSA